MKYRKFSREEKKRNRQQKLVAIESTNKFIFQNPHNANLDLPKALKDGRKQVGPKEKFEGDDYFVQLARQGMLIFVGQIKEEEKMPEQKLILDQPNTVTHRGTVEQVVEPLPVKPPLTEQGVEHGEPFVQEVLLNESPMDDGFMIIGD